VEAGTWPVRKEVDSMNQEPPFALQIEPVEGCTLACSFCGISSIRSNGADAATGKHGTGSPPYRFMDMATVYRLAEEVHRLKWNPRIEFAMHGEPTLHRMLPNMIRAFRMLLPKAYIMVTSNGSGVTTTEKLLGLFNAGLNTLALDDYKHAHFMQRVRPLVHEAMLVHGIPYFNYPADPRGNPHQRHAKRMVAILADISANSTGTHQLTNQGCSNSIAAEELNERCAKPFRELSVRWDGNVALCCDDWRGVYKIGNVQHMPLDTLWNHERFEAARRTLYAGQRTFAPCRGCNVRTYRNGLLPDKKGQGTMPAPDADTRRTVRGALAGQVFTLKLASPMRAVRIGRDEK